ncbi:MAG: hypothetical protein ACI9C1_003135 [Candidatus Aldehydirespiratoraceae bacterium]|jgi:hypothetical protein
MSDNHDFDLSAAEAELDAILRSMSAGDLKLETPPDSVWDGIAAAAESTLAPVIDLRSRRRQAGIRWAAAAAVVALIAGFGVVLTNGSDTSEIEVASAELLYPGESPDFDVVGEGRSADVTLLIDGDDELVRFEGADLPPVADGNDLELWLIGVTDGEIEIIQTLGVVGDVTNPGSFVVPEDFDRSAYDAVAVDISIEPQDGVEAHSGVSIVRGNLA